MSTADLNLRQSLEILERFPIQNRRGVLSDRSIYDAVKLGMIVISPFRLAQLQAASYDVTLAQDVVLNPGDGLLADTIEWFEVSSYIRGVLAGRSSVGRRFVFAHVQAGYIDPGFTGTITLELLNSSRIPQEFKRGDRLAQVSFDWLDCPAKHPYQGRYQGQRGPTESRFEHGDL